MNARDVILREMGLTPVWKDRSPASSLAAGASPEDTTVEAAGEAAGTAAPAVAASASVAANAQSQPVADSAAMNEVDRAAAIAAMSWDELTGKHCPMHRLQALHDENPHRARRRRPPAVVDGGGRSARRAGGERGEPFVGKAGQLLDAMLAAVGKKRGEGVYIANVIKCRPPGNRNPEPDEIAACAPFLKRQVALAQPKLLLAAGNSRPRLC